MEENFILRIIAELNKVLSKKSINGTLRTLDNTMYVRVLAKLSMTLARKQLKSQLKELNDLYVKVGANVNIDKNAKAQLQKNIQMLQQSISDLEIGLKTSKYQQNKINAEIKSIRNKIQQDAENHPISFNLQVKKEKLLSDIEYLGKRYSKLFSNVSATQKYEKIMSNAFNVSDKWQLADVRAELSAFTSELKANGLATQSTADKWKSLVDRSKDLFSAATLVRVVFSQIRESVSTFTELDTAMTGVWKVSNDITSREQFSGLLTKWNKLAQDLSVTTTSLINSIEEWSKIGFDLDMSEQLAELTTIFEKTAEISNELANSTLVSTAQAFTQIDDYGEEDYVERVEAIGNKINAIGNKYAISSEGISEALQNSSAALVMANNDLDESIAMITAGNKIFQSPEEMGTTLKVVSARLRAQKGELEELGEDTEGMIESVSKVQTQILNLTGNKVNIFESDNETLKSTYDILLEVGKVYDSLSDKDQASLTEIMFGKQRMSAGSSILLNYEELEQVKNDSINAGNSMAEEYAKYMESAEASITTFKEKLTEAYSAFMSGDLIKYAADTGSAFLDLVNSTDLFRHSLLAIVSINVGKGLSAIGVTAVSTAKQMNILGSALEQVKNLPIDDVLRKKAISQLGDETKILTEKNLELLLSQKQLTEIDKIAILKKSNLTDEEVRAKLAKMQLTTATNNQSKANVKEATTTSMLSGAMTTLKTSIKGVGLAIKSSFLNNPIGWVLTGITTAVSIASTAMDNYNQKLEEQREQIKQTAEESADNAQSLLDLQKQLDDDTVSAEDLTTAFREQLRAMGYTETEIDTLIDKYGNLAGAIDEATEKALENAKTDAYADVSTTGKSLIADAKGNTNIGAYYSQYKELSEEIQRMLEDSPAILDGGVFRMDKDASAEDIYEYYLVLKDISQLIQETANETGDDSLLGDSTPYYQVTEALDALSESAELYGDAINRLHNADAQLELSDYLKTNDIDTQEAFDTYIEGIKNSTTYSDTYKEVLLEVANDAFPQFSSAVKSAGDSVSDFANDTGNSFSDIFALEDAEGETTALGKLNDQVDELQKAYTGLKEIMDSYNESGTFTLDQVQEIISYGDEYLKYLMDENGNLQLNEEALNNVAVARINEMRAKAISNLMDNLDNITNEESALAYLETQLLETASAYDDLTESRISAWLAKTVDSDITDATQEKLLTSFRNKANAINEMFDNISIGSVSSSKSSSAETDFKELLDSYLNLYEAELNAGIISFDDFLSKSRSMLDQYYREGKISAADYWGYVEDLYKQQLSIYDKVLSAVTRRLDKEIDGIKDIIEGIEKQNDALNKQKDEYDGILSVVEDVYNTKIESIQAEQKAIQDTIDKLQEENDEKQRQIDLEKARYQLYQSLNNRNVKLFNGQEFIYTTNRDEIRDAQQNLADLELEETISALEKEKEALDVEIEKLEEFKQKWQEVANVYETEVNKQLAIALWGKNYEEMILSNRISDIEDFKNNYVSIQKQIDNNQGLIDSYNEKITYYENLKSQWSSIADAYENAQEDMLASQVLGANWETQVLSGRMDTLNTFKNNYIATQQAMADAAVQSANTQIQAINAVAEAQRNNGGNTVTTTAIENSSAITTIEKPSDDAFWYDPTTKKSGSVATISKNNNNHIMMRYGTGTENAKQGIHQVSEKGDEIILDNHGNALLAKGKQLHYFEGGETVIKSSETIEFLKNQGNMIPVQTWFDNLDTLKFMKNMPQYTPNISMPNYDFAKMNHNTGTTISIGDIHLHEVQNVDSFADAIIREFPNVVTQKIYK